MLEFNLNILIQFITKNNPITPSDNDDVQLYNKIFQKIRTFDCKQTDKILSKVMWFLRELYEEIHARNAYHLKMFLTTITTALTSGRV